MAELSKLGKLYEQPRIYLAIILFAIFIYLTYDRVAGTVLSFLTVASWLSYIMIKPKILINGVKKNTAKAWIVAVFLLAISIGASAVIGSLFFGWTSGSLVSFFQYNKGAVLGSEALPFAGNILLTILVFVFAFPIVETPLYLQLFDLVLRGFNARPSFSDWRLWASLLVMGVGVIFYHIYAKATVTGSPNPNTLMVVFIIFTVEGMGAIYTKEGESSVYHHCLNNFLAIASQYKLI